MSDPTSDTDLEPADVPRGWDWFAEDGDPSQGARRDLAACYRRCFSGSDGARVLAHLRALTLDRALGPGASDAALRHLEGQRHLVLGILRLAARDTGP